MSFSQYEKYHLHDYVGKKGTSYTKEEVDNKITVLKSEITTLINSNIKTLKTQMTELIKTSIQTALGEFTSNIQKSIIEFRNEQIRGRIGRKALTIPKTNETWIKILDASEIDGVATLQEIIIQNVYIRRWDRYHHAKSDLVASSFEQLEFFFKADFKEYHCYFNNHPSDWGMECFLEYIVIPKEISIEDPLINEIIENIEKLVRNIRKLYSNIK